jgi:hypothetical protein
MDKLTHEIAAMNEFLKAQRTSLGVGVTATVAEQCNQLVSRISSVAGSVTAQAATDITNVIEQGIWTADQKTLLLKAVSDRLLVDPSTSGGKAADKRRCNQRMKHFQMYFRQPDIDVITSDSHIMTKMQHVVHLCWSLGLIMPDEASIKHIVAVCLLASGGSATPPDKTYDIVQEFKSLLRHSNRGNFIPPGNHHVENYPCQPQELPRLIFNHCYNESPPVQLDIDESRIQAFSDMVVLRKSNKQIRSHGHGQSHGSSASSSSPMDLLHPVQQMMTQLVQLWAHNPATPTRPWIQYLPTQRQQAVPLQLTAGGTTPASESPVLPGRPCDDGVTSPDQNPPPPTANTQPPANLFNFPALTNGDAKEDPHREL